MAQQSVCLIMVVIHAAGVTTPRVRLCFAQFYFENHQSVLGSRGPASSSAHTKTAITAIDAEHALHDGRADADGAADLHLAPCMPSACSSGGGGVTLQTVCRVKAVNSSCNLGMADSAPPPAPRSRTRTPRAPPAEIRFIGHMAWRKRCDRAFASWSLF